MAKKQKPKAKAGGGMSGKFAYFRPKRIVRSWRLTERADQLLRDAGETLTDPDRDGDPVGTTEILETMTRMYARKITIDDVTREAKKG